MDEPCLAFTSSKRLDSAVNLDLKFCKGQQSNSTSTPKLHTAIFCGTYQVSAMPASEPKVLLKVPKFFDTPPPSLSTLPIELVVKLTDFLDASSLGRLMRANQRLNKVLQATLHERAIENRQPLNRRAEPALDWAVRNRKPKLVKYLFAHGITGTHGDPGDSMASIVEIQDAPLLAVNEAVLPPAPNRSSPKEATKALGRLLTASLVLEARKERQIRKGNYLDGEDCSKRTLKLVKILLSRYGADPNGLGVKLDKEYLRFGSQTFPYLTKDPQVFELLLKYDADVNANHDHRERNPKALPLLTHVIMISDDDDDTLIRMLLEKGANPNALSVNRRKQPYTALAYAVVTGKYKNALALLEYGAGVGGSWKWKGEITSIPFEVVARHTRSKTDEGVNLRFEVLQRILQRNANPRLNSSYDATSRLKEPYRVDIRMVEAALMNGSSLADAVKTISLLLEYGADPRAKDTQGQTFIQMLLDNFDPKSPKELNWFKVLAKVAAMKGCIELLPGDYFLRYFAAGWKQAQAIVTQAGWRRVEATAVRWAEARYPRNALIELGEVVNKESWDLLMTIEESYRSLPLGGGDVGSKYREFWRTHHRSVERCLFEDDGKAPRFFFPFPPDLELM
ncbi:hypothetical protein BU16DRAFT_597283 [Lophium mytilinum]|uniref:F-box domain-containing protein n=1 Tax=Lophium mytilinum TaxID=390894 RepID=A0A6A6QCF3_9PEZI|nr:hypothetical protein BU16DRAFT_597283 [Lophium mytilinum]